MLTTKNFEGIFFICFHFLIHQIINYQVKKHFVYKLFFVKWLHWFQMFGIDSGAKAERPREPVVKAKDQRWIVSSLLDICVTFCTNFIFKKGIKCLFVPWHQNCGEPGWDREHMTLHSFSKVQIVCDQTEPHTSVNDMTIWMQLFCYTSLHSTWTSCWKWSGGSGLFWGTNGVELCIHQQKIFCLADQHVSQEDKEFWFEV